MSLSRTFLRVLGITLTVIAGPIFAEDHLVALGAAWPEPADVSPGDRILLQSGLHPPQDLSGYRGTADAPILITAGDSEVPTGIGSSETGGWSLRISNCDHVMVRGLIVMAAGAGGIEVSGSGKERTGTIGLVDLQLLPSDPAALPNEGVAARGLDRITIVGVRIRGWVTNAVRVTDTRMVDARLIISDGSIDETTCRTGLLVERSDRILIDSASFVGLTDSAITVEIDKTAKTTMLRIFRSVFFRTETPLLLRAGSGSRLETLLKANTYLEPGRLIAVEEPEGPASSSSIEARMENCLVSWTVGGLKEIAKASPDTLDLTLGPNLWASQEADILFGGGFAFTEGQAAKQVLNVEPDLDPRTLLARNPDARAFGHGFQPDNSDGPE